MRIQNHSSISYSEEIASEIADNYTSSNDHQMKHNNNFAQASMNSKAKRINKNDQARWNFAWGPPV